MATVYNSRGQAYNVPDETLESHLDAGLRTSLPTAPVDFSTLKVERLRALLHGVGLPTTGKKPDLIARLREHTVGQE